jgi:hypothetical protein
MGFLLSPNNRIILRSHPIELTQAEIITLKALGAIAYLPMML